MKHFHGALNKLAQYYDKQLVKSPRDKEPYVAPVDNTMWEDVLQTPCYLVIMENGDILLETDESTEKALDDLLSSGIQWKEIDFSKKYHDEKGDRWQVELRSDEYVADLRPDLPYTSVFADKWLDKIQETLEGLGAKSWTDRPIYTGLEPGMLEK